MNKVKLGLVLVSSVFLFACGQKEEVVSGKEFISKISELSSENTTLEIQIEASSLENLKLLNEKEKLISRNQILQTELDVFEKKAQKKQEYSQIFWKNVQDTITEFGIIKFFTQDKKRVYSLLEYGFNELRSIDNINKSGYAYIYYDGFPALQDEAPRIVNNANENPFTKVERNFQRFISKVSKSPKALQAICDAYCSIIGKHALLEHKIEIQHYIDTYVVLLEIAQQPQFQQLAKNLLDVEQVHGVGSTQQTIAREALTSQYPKWNRYQLQTAYSYLSGQGNEWLSLIHTIEESFGFEITMMKWIAPTS